jgi:hypothetical protein
MKISVSGYYPILEKQEAFLENDLSELDGFKLHSLNLFITEIYTKTDIDKLIDGLKIIREGFVS